MLLTYHVQSGDIRVTVPVTVQEGEEFREGTTRYRVEGFQTDDKGDTIVECRLISGTHPFWWANMTDGEKIYFPATFLARMLHEKRAFGLSTVHL